MSSSRTPRLETDGPFALWNAPVGFRVVDAEPGARVRFDVTGATSSGEATSWAVVVVDDGGVADPARHPAVEGSYLGHDPRGLWWSLDPTSGPDRLAFEYEIEASIDGSVVGTTALSRSAIAPDAHYEELPHPLVGYLFHPAGEKPATPVLVLGGSEGGVQSAAITAALLAEEGFFAIALAYFGAPGLPDMLRDIPLESFVPALVFARDHERSCDDLVRIVGASRGGEAALLLAANYPDLVGPVVACPGSGIAWNGFPPGTEAGEVTYAWTIGGEPVDYPRVPGDELLDLDLTQDLDGDLVTVSARGFTWFLDNVPESVAAAEIPIERARGPVLMLAGADDHFAPSVRYAEMTRSRAERHGCPEVEVVTYPGAGHNLGPPGDAMPTVIPMGESPGLSLGGSREINALAQADAWQRKVSFLR